MRIITSAKEMTDHTLSEKGQIGYIPTMGALHKGHRSLIERAQKENDVVVVSVFVNPTQFNNQDDLNRYPRIFEQDREFLIASGVNVMFYPSVDEIYPSSQESPTCDLDGLDKFMEGPNRPGHFNGVVQVVSRLFDIVQPHRAYFGEKDFQQLAIIRHVSSKLGYPIRIIGCPTVRESDGLAMSSRNMLLSTDARSTANIIHDTLLWLKKNLRSGSTEQCKQKAIEMITTDNQLDLEYLELVDPDTLKPIGQGWKGAVQACIAATIGGVRLIDNMQVK